MYATENTPRFRDNSQPLSSTENLPVSKIFQQDMRPSSRLKHRKNAVTLYALGYVLLLPYSCVAPVSRSSMSLPNIGFPFFSCLMRMQLRHKPRTAITEVTMMATRASAPRPPSSLSSNFSFFLFKASTSFFCLVEFFCLLL